MTGWCEECKHAYYDTVHGYVCTNDDSEYVADFVEYDHWCEEFAGRE